MADYCRCLGQEMLLWGNDPRIRGREVDTIFIGGGTPSLLSIENISLIIETLYDNFTVSDKLEFSLECNPGTVTREKLHAYRHLGVNRLSIGMQSTIDDELAKLGRIHTYGEFVNTFHMAREADFEYINIDVMAAIPGQTLDSYKTTLKRVVELQPEHISSYSLIIEEGTPFYERYVDEPPVDEDTDREMYECTEKLLANAGYCRYEISNYAREGCSCKHNLKYWRRDEYLGMGLGASSFLGNERFHNERLLDSYQKEVREGRLPIMETEVLTSDEEMAEFMYLGLRCMKGVSPGEFERCFGVKLNNVYGEVIAKLAEQGLLTEKEGCIALTKKGIDISNLVFAEFI